MRGDETARILPHSPRALDEYILQAVETLVPVDCFLYFHIPKNEGKENTRRLVQTRGT